MNRKKSIFILLLLCVLMIPATYASASDVIGNNKNGIPDKGLYRDILNKLGKKPKETFTRQEAEQIRSLSVYSNIKNIKGIKYLKNLKKLSIEGKRLKSLNGIQGLKKLEVINMSDNNIKSLKPLKNLNGNSVHGTMPVVALLAGHVGNLAVHTARNKDNKNFVGLLRGDRHTGRKGRLRIPVKVVCGGQLFRFRGVVVHHRAARGKGQNQPRRNDKGK